MGGSVPTSRAIIRIVAIVVGVIAVLYVAYLLRTPLSWLVVAAFLAVAVAAPVEFLARRMPRGLAIGIVYLGVVLLPIALAALLVPPVVTEASGLIARAPDYAQDVSAFVESNDTLQRLEQQYDITGTLEEEAAKLPSKIGDAAGALRDFGAGIVGSVFAAVTILILSIFMVGGGPRWIRALLERQPPERAERLRGALDSIGVAVGSYVGGAMFQATIAGVTTFVVLVILGVPAAGTLAVVVALLDLIPLVGATLGAVLVGIVTLFTNFPTATIVWVIWAIVYQQLENNVIQPQIQRRAVRLEPFVVLVAVLFGSTLFGVIGAILAIPLAATLQIAAKELLAYRAESRGLTSPTGVTPGPPPGPAAEPP
jgi:predicted PurR-regulated permease PerM